MGCIVVFAIIWAFCVFGWAAAPTFLLLGIAFGVLLLMDWLRS